MEELIQQLTSKLGIDPSVANAATQKAMAMVKEHAGEDLFAKISSAIPGAGDAADAGATPADDGGGMLGAIAGMASNALGGSAGEALELGSELNSAGLEAGQFGDFASTIIDFLKDKLGDEVLEQILEKVPMLKGLIS